MGVPLKKDVRRFLFSFIVWSLSIISLVLEKSG